MAQLDRPSVARAFTEMLGIPCEVVVARPWASISFCGFRVLLESSEQIGADVAESLSEIDFTIPGLIVADVDASPVDRGSRIEALLVREGR